MSRKAVDVVLLTSEPMTDIAIEANAELVKKFGEKIVLNKIDCLPHISLAMGCINESCIGDITSILDKTAKQSRLGQLKIIDIRDSSNSTEQTVSVLEVEKTDELQQLHEKVMNRLARYLSADVTKDMVFGSEEVADSTLEWIRNYREKSSFANFFPHITIGYGYGDILSLPIEFAVSKLALCHLGNHCTCREILASVEFKS